MGKQVSRSLLTRKKLFLFLLAQEQKCFCEKPNLLGTTDMEIPCPKFMIESKKMTSVILSKYLSQCFRLIGFGSKHGPRRYGRPDDEPEFYKNIPKTVVREWCFVSKISSLNTNEQKEIAKAFLIANGKNPETFCLYQS